MGAGSPFNLGFEQGCVHGFGPMGFLSHQIYPLLRISIKIVELPVERIVRGMDSVFRSGGNVLLCSLAEAQTGVLANERIASVWLWKI